MMDDLVTMNPAKLKRRKRSGTSAASVVDLPAVCDAPSGALLGDELLSDISRADVHPSLRDMNAASGDATLRDDGDSDAENDELRRLTESEPDDAAPASSPGGDLSARRGLSLADLKPEPAPEFSSPLDALQTENREIQENSGNDGLKTSSGAKSGAKRDMRPAQSHITAEQGASRRENPFPDALQPSVRSLAAQKARRKMTPLPVSDDDFSALPAKFDEILAQNRDIQNRCLDTLTRLQHTNALNERRYALYLTVGFALLVIIAAVGIFFGISRQNNAKFQELRFKHEVYTSTINEKNILAAEFEKEKQGAVAAYEILKRIENGRLEEAVEEFTNANDRITHPAERTLLAQRIDQIRWELAENAFNSGVLFYNAQNFEQARDAFFKSLSLNENTSYAPRLYYYLAMSLYQLSDFEGAMRFFAHIQNGELNSEMDANARFYRAASAEKSGNDAEAYEQFDQFIKKYRYHRLSDEAAKRRSKLDQPKR